jgi:hypothetical protein
MFLDLLRRLFNIAHISRSGMGWAKLLTAVKGLAGGILSGR